MGAREKIKSLCNISNWKYDNIKSVVKYLSVALWHLKRGVQRYYLLTASWNIYDAVSSSSYVADMVLNRKQESGFKRKFCSGAVPDITRETTINSIQDSP
jgi:hypothetical protein